MNIKQVNIIQVQDFDKLVQDTYKRPYSFQQQDGCKNRGIINVTIPDYDYDYENDLLPEICNGDEMGVSFKAWLEADPERKLLENGWDYTSLWWHRNFYPDYQMVLNDLHDKGLIPAGDYIININW